MTAMLAGSVIGLTSCLAATLCARAALPVFSRRSLGVRAAARLRRSRAAASACCLRFSL